MTHSMIDDISFDAGKWPLQADRPTILFIHGSGNNRLFWKNQLEGLTDCANTIAVDLPGHGESPGTGMDSVDDYARVVKKLIASLQAPMPIPCGLSLGGAVALQMLLDGKGRYHAGILINTGSRLRVLPQIFDQIKTDYQAYTESSPQMAASPKTDRTLLKGYIEASKKCPPDVVYKDFAACNAFDVMARLQEISETVLILSAEDDLLTPPKYAQFLHQGIPNSRIVSIPRAGHLSPIERPNDVNRAIREFIGQLA
jgi:pimeloyl-ACP methyl ester carboxylesterase